MTLAIAALVDGNDTLDDSSVFTFTVSLLTVAGDDNDSLALLILVSTNELVLATLGLIALLEVALRDGVPLPLFVVVVTLIIRCDGGIAARDGVLATVRDADTPLLRPPVDDEDDDADGDATERRRSSFHDARLPDDDGLIAPIDERSVDMYSLRRLRSFANNGERDRRRANDDDSDDVGDTISSLR